MTCYRGYNPLKRTYRSSQDLGSRKRGVEFKGGSLHNDFGSFDGFGGSGKHPTLLSLVLHKHRTKTDGSDGSGGFDGCGGLVVTATPLKLNPPFPTS